MQHTIVALDYDLTDFSDTTSSAFLVAALQWAAQVGFWQPFARLMAIAMKTITYSPLHKIQTLVASIIIGCQFNKDINVRLVPDQVAAASLGLAHFPDQSQLNLLLRRLDAGNLLELQAVHAEHLAHFAAPAVTAQPGRYLFVDIDQCGLVVSGKTYQLARKDYFPRQRGAHGYQLGAAFLSGADLTLALRLAPGNTHCSTQLPELAAEAAARCAAIAPQRPLVFRLDAGYGGRAHLRGLARQGWRFLAKGKVTAPQKWAAHITPTAWQAVPGAAGVEVAEDLLARRTRAIVCRVVQAQGGYEYKMLLTNLPREEFTAVQLWDLYQARQSIEAFFKTGRQVYGMGNLRSREFVAIYGFLWLVFITHNLLQWVKAALFAGTALAAVGTRELVEKLGRIPARREWTARGWRLLLPAQDALARLFVAVLRPQWCQLLLFPPRLYET